LSRKGAGRTCTKLVGIILSQNDIMKPPLSPLCLIVGMCLLFLQCAALTSVLTLSRNVSAQTDVSREQPEPASTVPATPFQGKKILWVSSYHQGYEANDDIEHGIRSVLEGTGVELRTFFMDTKRNDSPEFGKKAGYEAMAFMKKFHPDVVIASDDNAQKYLVVPYLRGGKYPVVFCGVNADPASYGYPATNVTGMVEVDLAPEMLELMRRYAKGDRIGYLSGNVDAERKVVAIYNKQFFHGKMKSYLVSSMAEFKETFLRAQQEVDMLYVYNYTGIKGWDKVEAELFLSRHTRVPTGSHNGFMSPFVVFVAAKSLVEHGEYAAETALKILQGAVPGKIPVTENRKVELYVNLRMAKAASITLPVSLLKTATVVGQDEAYLDDPPGTRPPNRYRGKKILWVDSYKDGYDWSDGIEKGIRSVLYETGAELHIFHMDTKTHDEKQYGAMVGQKAWELIQSYRPDVVIASDDNAQEDLVVPYLLGKELPVVFCGVNLDASRYGYPAANVTGMIEVDAVRLLEKYLQSYAHGSRIGYLAGDARTERQLVAFYNDRYYNGGLHSYRVHTMAEFKTAFLQAQDDVDMLVLANFAGIHDWDPVAAEEFIVAHNRIPSGSYLGFMAPYVVFTVAKVAEEQGNYAAKVALAYLDGTKATELPVRANHLSQLTINLKMAKASGIVLPFTMLRRAKVIGRNLLTEGSSAKKMMPVGQ